MIGTQYETGEPITCALRGDQKGDARVQKWERKKGRIEHIEGGPPTQREREVEFLIRLSLSPGAFALEESTLENRALKRIRGKDRAKIFIERVGGAALPPFMCSSLE